MLLFDAGLKYLRTVVDLGPKRKPRSVAFTKFCDVIVVVEEPHDSRTSSEISVFTEDKQFVKRITEHVRNPCSVSVSRTDGKIIVCDSGDISVKVLSPDGTEMLLSIRVPNCDAFPWFAVHHQEKYFVSYRMADCVKVFSEQGVPLFDIRQFGGPAGLSIDKFNQLIVCDSIDSSVRMLTLHGRLVRWLVRNRDGCPCSVAVTQNGEVLVSDAEKGSIYIFKK